MSWFKFSILYFIKISKIISISKNYPDYLFSKVMFAPFLGPGGWVPYYFLFYYGLMVVWLYFTQFLIDKFPNAYLLHIFNLIIAILLIIVAVVTFILGI